MENLSTNFVLKTFAKYRQRFRALRHDILAIMKQH